ncbi:MAG: phospholipase D-like domain-containing protein [Acidobacteriota bacterium]|nr:phospholipase D-like domain-containing protein [Acidobacteriota bacterium]
MVSRPVYHFISEDERFETRLLANLKNCLKAKLATAFFTHDAFRSFAPSLVQALSSGAFVEFLVGTGEYVTEPKALRGLLRIADKFPKQLRVLFDESPHLFHYKIATFKLLHSTAVILGSSNLTSKGLASIGEINLEIRNNRSVYKEASEFLDERIVKATNVEKHLTEYEKRYKRAEKFRRIRKHWTTPSRGGWMKHRRVTVPVKTDGDCFTFCWVREQEDDETLIKNIGKERRRAESKGMVLPDQWIHLEDFAEYRNYRENTAFVLADRLDNSLGFAVCLRKQKILDQNHTLQPVIVYRYKRGEKAKFSKKQKFDSELKKLGLNTNRRIIKSLLTRRLKEYLAKTQTNRKPFQGTKS